jgi:hypothetical protein
MRISWGVSWEIDFLSTERDGFITSTCTADEFLITLGLTIFAERYQRFLRGHIIT